MSGHRITYDIVTTGRTVTYTATCRCGIQRESRNADVLSAWGPEHVVTAWEREHAAA